MEEKKNKILRLVLLLIIILLVIVGVTYALITFVFTGDKENTIDISGFSLTYNESGTAINVNSNEIMTDEEGIASETGFTFSVTGTSEIARQVPYYIYLALDENNTMNDKVKFYLNDITSNSSYGPVVISDLELKQTNQYYFYENEFNFETTSQSITHNYELKTWLFDDTIDVTTTTDGKKQHTDITLGEFSFKINVETGYMNFPPFTQEFSYNSSLLQGQICTIPYTGYYKIELWGAKGGGTSGGKGAYTSGYAFLNKDEIIYVFVGGNGSSTNGGWNGGGKTNSGHSGTFYGSGGATDVRCFINNNRCISNSNISTWSDDLGLNSRIMVASGGSGFNGYTNFNSKGAEGGTLIGITGIRQGTTHTSALGGNQISGGLGAGGNTSLSGSFGKGGTGNSGTGGGGGYYGGGGGMETAETVSSGGGGSSYISGFQGCVAIASQATPGGTRTPRSVNGTECSAESAANDINCSYHYSGKIFYNADMKSGAEVMPTWDGTGVMTGNNNHGHAKITWVGFRIPE